MSNAKPAAATALEELATQAAQLPGAQRFSDEDLELVYGIAYNLYRHGRHDDALRYFAMLTSYRPLETRYLLGLGACQQMLRNYEGAIQAYALAAMVRPEAPEPSLHIAECLVAQAQFAEARTTLEALIRLCELSGQTALEQRARGLLELIGER
ncbi:SycD/LcrH family type III secretion system chaperone [Chitinimonas lacunae]|uniref:SycD/LcrH family type III secretion system chaperone n=1 Tax=Chitinimonas lacunae TaxID=1963018 RepID=A0ABV8MPF4_9NEIS